MDRWGVSVVSDCTSNCRNETNQCFGLDNFTWAVATMGFDMLYTIREEVEE